MKFLKPLPILVLNMAMTWPFFALSISIFGNKKYPIFGQVVPSWWDFFISGYSNNISLSISLSLAAVFLFTYFFNWLERKKDNVLERHFARSVVGGCLFSLINLFPSFFIYQLFLGETDIPNLIISSLVGPILSLGLVGPPASLAGAFIGLMNGGFVRIHFIFQARRNGKSS